MVCVSHVGRSDPIVVLLPSVQANVEGRALDAQPHKSHSTPANIQLWIKEYNISHTAQQKHVNDCLFMLKFMFQFV